MTVFYNSPRMYADSHRPFCCTPLGDETIHMTAPNTTIERFDFPIPESSEQYGFRRIPVGTHGSKTMMLRELSLLFAASTPDTPYAELRRLALDENVLLKDTASNRKEVFTRLGQLYGLNRELLLYRALRALWGAGEKEHGLLALLCSLARDPLLRATTPVVLEQPQGSAMSPQMLEAAIQVAYPDRYSINMRASISRNALSSWTQSSHVRGHRAKTRARAVAGPAAAAYALFLGHLCGARGLLLMESAWAQVLDAPPGSVGNLAFAASQRGWLDYRRLGDVADISFTQLMKA
jgi:hypothetical protein